MIVSVAKTLHVDGNTTFQPRRGVRISTQGMTAASLHSVVGRPQDVLAFGLLAYFPVSLPHYQGGEQGRTPDTTSRPLR